MILLFLASSPFYQYIVFILPGKYFITRQRLIFWQLAFRRHLWWEYSSVNHGETSLTVVFKPRGAEKDQKSIWGRFLLFSFVIPVSLSGDICVIAPLNYLRRIWKVISINQTHTHTHTHTHTDFQNDATNKKNCRMVLKNVRHIPQNT